MAATLNWVIKDGLGLLGGVVYTSIFSGRFDSEPKRYRFKAAVALQMATFCELMTPLMPSMFLVMASLSNIGKLCGVELLWSNLRLGKNIAWLALSGTRAQMHQSLCLKDNLGDITAKSGSQSTGAGLMGTGLGVVAAAIAGDSFMYSMALYLPLGCIGLFSIYQSNSVVLTRSLNLQRTERIFHDYLAAAGPGPGPARAKVDAHLDILTPAEISDVEVFVRGYRSVFTVPLSLGESVTTALPDPQEMGQVFQQKYLMQKEHYYLHVSRDRVYLWVDKEASPDQFLQGFLHSSLLRLAKAQQRPDADADADAHHHHHSLIRSTHAETLVGCFLGMDGSLSLSDVCGCGCRCRWCSPFAGHLPTRARGYEACGLECERSGVWHRWWFRRAHEVPRLLEISSSRLLLLLLLMWMFLLSR